MPINPAAVRPCEVPLNSLLLSYKDGDGFADCYVAEVAGAITQEAFVEAFYFGSAVVPRPSKGARNRRMGRVFHALLGFHRLYSRLLLLAASKRVRSA